MATKSNARAIPFLLFGSGLCALVYQVAWTREFRLVFGASTAASAAVLAIFIGGLGAGGVVLGRRVDRHPRPLVFYAQLEALVALSAALTPPLLFLVRGLYVALGGAVALGPALGTAARLLLAALVLSVPTFLMGGTLPAAARAIASDEDRARRAIALLYGVNTLGAVTGCLLSTFLLLEVFGTRVTLWMASLVNLLVAVVALRVGRELHDDEDRARGAARARGEAPAPAQDPAAEAEAGLPPRWFSLLAAALSGFAFFLMELVWYRMLGPLLGGTVFTFGLILALALFGIGLGGFFYATLGGRRPATLSGFSFTCLLEALCVAVPFALGDRIALFALVLRPLGNLGFAGHVLGWTLVGGVVVVPAAFVAGVQFPLLIALLGRGRREVGRQIGLAYAWNTAGAMLGSLGGGFGLLPALGAPGCWRAVALLLALTGLAAALLAAREQGGARALPGPLALALLAPLLLSARGPTAAWRHSPIGAGRVEPGEIHSANSQEAWLRAQRGRPLWEREGVESSVALSNSGDALSFVVNGKVDGNAVNDASTQVMMGLVGSLLHPAPRLAMVIGLGTGSTAGWVAAVGSIERVDVVELEPAILEVARACAPVNHRVMDNPRVHVRIGDAREVLLTSRERYDLVLSEPSNPYRAGVSSLFTREYYAAARGKMAPGGLFLQWVQGYEVSAQTVRTLYATLASVFPSVETWELTKGDLLLVASEAPVRYDAARLRARVAEEPFRAALAVTWGVTDLEGALSHFVARPELASAIAREESGALNTDDRAPVEFGFARTVGAVKGLAFSTWSVRNLARARGEHRPPLPAADIDWEEVEDQLLASDVRQSSTVLPQPYHSPTQRARTAAYQRYLADDRRGALAALGALPARNITEIEVLADSLADGGDERAVAEAARLSSVLPAETDLVLARLRLRQGRLDEAAALFESAFLRCREEPWAWHSLLQGGMQLAEAMSKQDPPLRARLRQALSRPFAVYLLDAERSRAHLRLASHLADPAACVDALAYFEPEFPWDKPMLSTRYACYFKAGHPLAARASEQLVRFVSQEPLSFDDGLVPDPPPAEAPPGRAAPPAP